MCSATSCQSSIILTIQLSATFDHQLDVREMLTSMLYSAMEPFYWISVPGRMDQWHRRIGCEAEVAVLICPHRLVSLGRFLCTLGTFSKIIKRDQMKGRRYSYEIKK